MQDRDQYVHFTIKLLKSSFALNALWQDALNYHMIDQPDKLIAMRLTEYYELVARGTLRPGPSMLGVAPSPTPNLAGNTGVSASQQQGASTSLLPNASASGEPAGEISGQVFTPSNEAEQNAEEAADYWSPL